MKIAVQDPRWKVAAEETDLSELLDEFEDNCSFIDLEDVASQIEDAVEALPGHGGNARFHARDLGQALSNMKKVLRELRNVG
jgi:hypothetical protein